LTISLSCVFPSASVKRALPVDSGISIASGCECIGLFSPAGTAILNTRTAALSRITL
jgi:hypothetical protein